MLPSNVSCTDLRGSQIPRRVHFIWLQGVEHLLASEPAYFANLDRTRELMGPDWEVRLWTRSDIRDLLGSKRPELLERFDSIAEPAMQADIGRFAILEAYGGIYLDVDFIVTRSLAPLLCLADEPYIALRRLRVGSFIHSILNGSLSAQPESLQN
jgi:mannosyltransferase OCH1-like enzyme